MSTHNIHVCCFRNINMGIPLIWNYFQDKGTSTVLVYVMQKETAVHMRQSEAQTSLSVRTFDICIKTAPYENVSSGICGQ